MKPYPPPPHHPPASTATATPSLFLLTLLTLPILLHALGTGSTIAAVYGTQTVCGIIGSLPIRRIECYSSSGQHISIQPKLSYESIAAGRSFFCGLHSGGNILLCWDTPDFLPKRIYFTRNTNPNSDPLRMISIGSDQVIAISNRTNQLLSWRDKNGSTDSSVPFVSVSSGSGFTCGIVTTGLVTCWGSDSSLAETIQSQFRNISMSSIVAGGEHVCGFSTANGSLLCGGSNSSGQLNAPSDERFTQLALGFNFTCGVRESNYTVVCWGQEMESSYSSSSLTSTTSFELITSGSDFVCGLSSSNFTVICWGPGWGNDTSITTLTGILPGQCVDSASCQCGIYPQSDKLCSNTGVICSICSPNTFTSAPPFPPAITPPPYLSMPPQPSSSSSSKSRSWRRGALLAFAIVGSIGTIAGILTVFYCLYTGGFCFGRKKIHNSVQPTIARAGSNPHNTNPFARNSSGSSGNNNPLSRTTSTIRRQGSRLTMMRRQRSGTSSTKHPDRAEEFTFQELVKATDNFSFENKIGAGSFGVVYRGKLPSDGREVAIKRGETSTKSRKYQEKESAFESEIAFLSRLHHKHLVRLVGYCEEREERLLVYDYMRNGALYDHLHGKENVGKDSSLVNSWKMRIGIALDAARGIEYLHSYAVPPIIHRDIKSSNILLDGNWTAKVSDFGLSLMGPETEVSGGGGFRPMKAAGTVGYMDPEYYEMNVLTAKSDVYGLGVVLLELLTGKRAIFRVSGDVGDGGGGPMSVVDYAVPAIMEGELGKLLDKRVGMPSVANEAEAIELVAYTALHCVHLEGKDRPSMTDIVANLERALGLCDESHGTISSASISVSSD